MPWTLNDEAGRPVAAWTRRPTLAGRGRAPQEAPDAPVRATAPTRAGATPATAAELAERVAALEAADEPTRSRG